MKNSVIIIAIVAVALFAACQKNDMMDNSINIDINKYKTSLNQDYNQANEFHLAMIQNSTDMLYNKMMFNTNDSLFSQHFYEFCIDMMENSGMMSDSNGMMGNNNGMMNNHDDDMMNGSTMGSMDDMNEMMNFMDSLHTSNPDYFICDSLMYNQMTMCKMMSSQTNDIEDVYNKMQTLRKNHILTN